MGRFDMKEDFCSQRSREAQVLHGGVGQINFLLEQVVFTGEIFLVNGHSTDNKGVDHCRNDEDEHGDDELDVFTGDHFSDTEQVEGGVETQDVLSDPVGLINFVRIISVGPDEVHVEHPGLSGRGNEEPDAGEHVDVNHHDQEQIEDLQEDFLAHIDVKVPDDLANTSDPLELQHTQKLQDGTVSVCDVVKGDRRTQVDPEVEAQQVTACDLCLISHFNAGFRVKIGGAEGQHNINEED